jgi:hypothetical protein
VLSAYLLNIYLRIDKEGGGKGRLEIKDLDNAIYYYNLLATTTTVFKFSTTPAPSFIAYRKMMYIPIRSASPSSPKPSNIIEPEFVVFLILLWQFKL